MEQNKVAGLFSILPVELLGIICDYFDTIIILRNFTITCQYIYNLDIRYNRFLFLATGFFYGRGNHYYWSKYCDKLKGNKMCREIFKLNHYFNACKFIYQFNFNLLPVLSILGFYTDLLPKVLNPEKLKCFYYTEANKYELIHYKVIDHGCYRQVIFTNEAITKNMSISYKNWTQYFSVYDTSEIIMGKHFVYTENNIIVNHSTKHSLTIKKLPDNFISFYS